MRDAPFDSQVRSHMPVSGTDARGGSPKQLDGEITFEHIPVSISSKENDFLIVLRISDIDDTSREILCISR